MSTNDPADPSIAHWPGDWPERQIVDLDNLGDPGFWLDGHIPDPEDALCRNDLEQDEELADCMTQSYITEAEIRRFPLPSDFGMEHEEMFEAIEAEFLEFIREWRRRVSSGPSNAGIGP